MIGNDGRGPMMVVGPERASVAFRQRLPGAAKGALALLSLAFMITDAIGETVRTIWTHNDSEVYLYATGQQREFRYRTPKPELLEAGVQPGTLLFKGTRVGMQYSGTTYVFPRPCGSLPYPVAGPLSPDGHTVTMYGSAPSAIYSDCTVAANRDDVLVFELSEQTGETSSASEEYGADGRLFSSGSDEYFLLSKTSDQRENSSGYRGQTRVVHHFRTGGFEVLMKDYTAWCVTADNYPSVSWSTTGDANTPVTIPIRSMSKPKSQQKESYNLYWAACRGKFRRFK
jgi:hypothetical protein